MGKLIYGMIQSLDGYTEDADGKFDWGAPDEEMHAYVTTLAAGVGTYLYGRRMYETMVYWETALEEPNQPPAVRGWAEQWQAAEKIVYSTMLMEPRSARTRIDRSFDVAAIRRMKDETPHDLAVNGPLLAAQALRGGLVDEVQMIVYPVVVGGGKRFFPDDVRMELVLVDEKSFASGVVVLRYDMKKSS